MVTNANTTIQCTHPASGTVFSIKVEEITTSDGIINVFSVLSSRVFLEEANSDLYQDVEKIIVKAGFKHYDFLPQYFFVIPSRSEFPVNVFLTIKSMLKGSGLIIS